MKHFNLHYFWLLPSIFFFFRCSPGTVKADLTWDSTSPILLPRVADTLYAGEEFPDTTFLLRGPALRSVRKTVRNLLTKSFSPETRYSIRVTLDRYAFQPDSLAYLPGGATILDTLIRGPLPILEGNSATFTVKFNRDLPCGLFKLSFLIDSTGRHIRDVNPANNLTETFIFVPADPTFEWETTNPDTTQIYAAWPPPVALTLNVLPIDTALNEVFYTGLQAKSTHGSTVISVPAPPLRLSPLPSPIQVTVRPASAPAGAVEDVWLELTLFSKDGCVRRRKSAVVRVVH